MGYLADPLLNSENLLRNDLELSGIDTGTAVNVKELLDVV